MRPTKASGEIARAAVDRRDNEDGAFVMSLSIGETVRMRHPAARTLDYFVVFKIDSTKTIHFTSHWDAGKSKKTDQAPGREDIKRLPWQLQELGESPDEPPRKIWVGPLGDVRELVKD